MNRQNENHRTHPRLVGDPRRWTPFRHFYEERGYQVLTPAWPRMQGEVGVRVRELDGGIFAQGHKKECPRKEES
jgi:hypothetical protein